MRTWILIALFSIPAARGDDFTELCRQVSETYAQNAHAAYEDAHAGAVNLRRAVRALTDSPTAENLARAKRIWISARQPYLQTEVFRFYGGPIDDEDGPEPMINGWPMDEFYIDYVVDAPKCRSDQRSGHFSRNYAASDR